MSLSFASIARTSDEQCLLVVNDMTGLSEQAKRVRDER